MDTQSLLGKSVVFTAYFTNSLKVVLPYAFSGTVFSIRDYPTTDGENQSTAVVKSNSNLFYVPFNCLKEEDGNGWFW
jgi:hypothetical protein